jgi:hypothetical protein
LACISGCRHGTAELSELTPSQMHDKVRSVMRLTMGIEFRHRNEW